MRDRGILGPGTLPGGGPKEHPWGQHAGGRQAERAPGAVPPEQLMLLGWRGVGTSESVSSETERLWPEAQGLTFEGWTVKEGARRRQKTGVGGKPGASGDTAGGR